MPVICENIEEVLCFKPVIHGFWTHKDLVQNVFDFDDLLDIIEIIDVKEENEKRYQEFIKITQGKG